MKKYSVESTSIIKAPASLVYAIIADYRDGHPHILPKPYFVSLTVVEGGHGEGTIANCEMLVMGQKVSFRAIVTEPEPGRVLMETNLDQSGNVTSFILTPVEQGQNTEVKIKTEGKTQKSGLLGSIEKALTKTYLRRIYSRELQLLDALAQKRQGDARAGSV